MMIERGDYVWMFIAYAATLGVWLRFLKYLKRDEDNSQVLKDALDKVSIILPVRNEETIINAILDSFFKLDYPALEVIVVDDASTDRTRELASAYPVKIITTPPKPPEWIGKSWANHIGARYASGKYLLFTDADTIHVSDGLTRALAFLNRTNSQLVSAPSFYRNELWWEKLLGPFYIMMHAGASPYDRVSSNNPYAVGQYILVEKDFYTTIGGHESVKTELADDASLARNVILHHGKCSIYKGKPLCKVQMYRSFATFCAGWIRIIRLGMNELKGGIALNTFVPLLALNVNNMMLGTLISLIPIGLTLLCFYLTQKKLGDFSILGILLFPIPILLFIVLATWAMIAHVLNLPVSWRGRKYTIKRKTAFQDVVTLKN